MDRALLRAPPRAARSRAGAKIGLDIYRTVGGYVTGNLLISLVAGMRPRSCCWSSTSPSRSPSAWSSRSSTWSRWPARRWPAIIIGAVAFIHSIPAGIVIIVFFVLDQQTENHLLQPPTTAGRCSSAARRPGRDSLGAELAGIPARSARSRSPARSR